MTFDELHEYMRNYTEIELEGIKILGGKLNPPLSKDLSKGIIPYKYRPMGRGKDIVYQRHSRYYQHSFHTHIFVEFMFMFEGEGLNITEKSQTKLSEGDICILTPYAWHLPYVAGENLLVNFCVDQSYLAECVQKLNHPSVLTDYLRSLDQNILPEYLHIKSGGDREIYECAERLMIAFIEDSWEDSDYERKCLFEELLLKLIKNRGNDAVRSPDTFSTNNLESRIFGIIENDYRTLTLEELAERLNYSKAHICRVIKSASGETFSSIVNRLRIRDACNLIKTSDLPISKIAYECGFDSIEYFNRVFRRYTSKSPSEYKQSPVFTVYPGFCIE